jgi:tetratricopeptide (TPR) repeat protein
MRLQRKISHHRSNQESVLKNIFAPIVIARPVRQFFCIGIISVTALLSGCANLHWFAAHPTEMPPAPELASTTTTAGGESVHEIARKLSADEKLPSVALTEELLYKLLTSEIAYQRGNWQAAYVTILAAAQQTRDPRLARRAAEMALAAKQPGESLAAIRLWRELAPDSNEATQYYLGFMIVNNNLGEIQKVFSERLVNAKPEQYGLLMLQAQRLLARARDKKAAFDTLEEILAPYKTTTEAHLSLAQGAYHSGDNVRAISEAQAALQLKPDSALAILTIAQASEKSQALKEVAAFLEKNPASRDVRLAYASMLIDTKQLDKASLEFEHLLRDKPDDVTSLYTLGALAMDSGQFKVAEKYFLNYLNALETQPEQERDPTPALINLAQIALERKDNKAAMNWLAKVDSYDGRNAAWLNVQLRRAQLIAKDGKLNEARQFLKDIKTGSEAEQVQVLQAESQLLRNAKKGQEALAVMEAGIQRFPNNTDLRYDYAMLAESLKQLDLMEQQLRRVIELAPNSQHAYNALGYSFADRNIHLDEALSLIEKALQITPDDPFILDSLGWVKFRLARYEEAEQALRRAYQLRPDPEIAVHLGEVLWVAGKKEAAKEYWREAKAKEPDNDTLKSTLLRLNVKP